LPFEDIHGVAASPVVAEGRLIVDSGNAKAPYIACIDPNSGERLWTIPLDPWPGQHGEHRTPLVFDGKIVRWAAAANTLSAYDLHTGQKLWSWPVPFKRTGEAVASILRDGDRLYLSSRSTMACVAMQNPPCIVWQTPMTGKGPNTASPVLHDGLLYAVSDQGFASCLDAESGELHWMERVSPKCLASPIIAGRFVYFPCTDGNVVVVACNREFSKVAENHLEGQMYASPAVVDGTLILRTTNGLWCIKGQ
jgi:hypothetical protein